MVETSFSVGAVFPQTDIGADPAAIRDYAQAMEDLGYSHIVAYDHVVGAHPRNRPGEWLPYNHDSEFHEPLTLFSFMAAITRRIGFKSGVIIAGQRQTVLLAKQAANVDVYCRGRLRLGLGIGYLPHEYEALGVDFKTRGRRFDDQIRFMRRLWTEPVLTEHGPLHNITDAGINPLPVQRPIPIHIGGLSAPALKRATSLGDGYLSVLTVEAAEPLLEQLNTAPAEAKRDPASLPMENIIILGATLDGPVRGPQDAARDVAFWRERGIAGAAIHTMGMNIKGVTAQIELMRQIADAIGLKRRVISV